MVSQIKAEVIADSESIEDVRITTFELEYPRFIHSEFMTHRALSRNASSSRAVPVAKRLRQVLFSPARPVHWGANQPGMQADSELGPIKRWVVKSLFLGSRYPVCLFAWIMDKLGSHKQVINRILEPWSTIKVVATATDWDNFFWLRCHKDADPTFKALADLMKAKMEESKPQHKAFDEWHLPYVSDSEVEELPIETAKLVSAARCARVSYKAFDGQRSTPEQDLRLAEKLIGRPGEPVHASPFEHQAMPDSVAEHSGSIYDNEHLHGNLFGWIQHRKMIPGEDGQPDDEFMGEPDDGL